MRQPARVLSAAVLAVMLLPVPGSAEEHLATPAAVQARLAEASAERAENIRTLQGALASPAAEQAAGYAHADLDRLRARVAYLTDEDLRDLAARSKLLELDPAAGTNAVILVLAVIGAAVLLLIIIAALSCWSGNCD